MAQLFWYWGLDNNESMRGNSRPGKQQGEKNHWIICNFKVDGQIFSVDLVEKSGRRGKGGVHVCVCLGGRMKSG